MFTVLQLLHLCVSDSLHVKALQASSVLAEILQSDIVGDDDRLHMNSLYKYTTLLTILLASWSITHFCIQMYQTLLPVLNSRIDAKCN